ncbi:chorismate synthase, partial [uncultured Bilophila sp.]
AREGIAVRSCTLELGGVIAPPFTAEEMAGAASRPFCAPCDAVVDTWEALVRKVRGEGDTLGGIVRVEVTGVPAGLGEPVFDKLDALLAQALMSVGAVKAVEIGDGFAAARSRGSLNNDAYRPAEEGSSPGNPETNHCGGILGGISTGQTLVMNAGIKPIPSIATEQRSVNAAGEAVALRVGGRHDICAIPRVNPVLEAMAALVVADALLLQRRMG